MNYITVRVYCTPRLVHELIAVLFDLAFDSFLEFEDGFEGSCESQLFDEKKLKDRLSNYQAITYQIKAQEKTNWNEEWEKNYDPIAIGKKILVRASFHSPQPNYPFEIVITPKMSFGTGHHATTYLVLDFLYGMDLQKKTVLDVGTGTGILAIMASKKGASSITATDIDDWCIENSEENFALNKVTNIKLMKRQITEIPSQAYNLIIANINKNVLLEQMTSYVERLKPGGMIILSGFYENDSDQLTKHAQMYGIKKVFDSFRDLWAMLVLQKPSV